jgi:hypothetical protein
MKDGHLDVRCSTQRGKNFSDFIMEHEIKMENTCLQEYNIKTDYE